eukprot:3903269-Prymnesium_polylepis.1
MRVHCSRSNTHGPHGGCRLIELTVALQQRAAHGSQGRVVDRVHDTDAAGRVGAVPLEIGGWRIGHVRAGDRDRRTVVTFPRKVPIPEHVVAPAEE